MRLKITFLFSFLCFFYAGGLLAQVPDNDTSYYNVYPGKVTARIYLSQKYTSISVPSGNNTHIQYTPDTKLTLGAGVTYRNLTLNLSFGFGFLNPEDGKVDTKSIDLQAHVYPLNKWAIDIYACRHKGLMISKNDFKNIDGSYYNRPDVHLLLAGVAAYRVFNGEAFSYNAAMMQSEWQTRSAGSWLAGGEAYYSSLSADSSLIPAVLQSQFLTSNLDKMHFITVGAGGGYAYTWVVKKHFFVTGSAIANLDVHFLQETTSSPEEKNTVSVRPSFIWKAAVGYNWGDWNVSANWAANELSAKSGIAGENYTMPTGNFRFMVAKRFDVMKRGK